MPPVRVAESCTCPEKLTSPAPRIQSIRTSPPGARQPPDQDPPLDERAWVRADKRQKNDCFSFMSPTISTGLPEALSLFTRSASMLVERSRDACRPLGALCALIR